VSASTAKRLILYRFDRQPVEVFVHTDTYLQALGLEVMLRDGSVQVIDYISVKALCFASEGAPTDLFTTQNCFERRPKTPGLWTSFRLRDDAVLEGVLSHNILEWPAQGYILTPPKANAYRQRVFLPRQAVQETALLGLVGKATALDSKATTKKKPDLEAGRQLNIFD
jgi:uncharacterized protein DUF6982